MPEKKVDLEALAKELGGQALELLKGKLSGSEADLKEFGGAIAKDMLSAVRTGDEAWRSELTEQVKVLGEIQRIRLNGVTWEVVTQTFFSIAKVAMKAVSLTTFL